MLSKIASVTTLASPHHGSALASAPAACILRMRAPTPDEIPPTVRTFAHLAGSFFRTRRFLAEAATGAALAPADTWKFLMQLWQHRGLVEECEPRRMERRLEECPLRPGVRLLWTSHGKVDPAVALGLGVGVASPAIRRILILNDPGSLGDSLGKLLSIDEEMPTIREALLQKFAKLPLLETYKQAAIRNSKAGRIDAAIWWICFSE